MFTVPEKNRNLLLDFGLSIHKTEYRYTNNSILFLNKMFTEDFDKNDLHINIIENINFEIKYSYSYDGTEWVLPTVFDLFNPPNDYGNFYVAIYLNNKINNETEPKANWNETKDNNKIQNSIVIDKILYNDDNIEFSVKTLYNTINRNSNWNIYDNQDVTLKQWIDTNVAITRNKGLTLIYFRTEATKTNHTLGVNYERETVDVKKFKFTLPDGNAPQDRLVYNEWDMGLPDEFMVQILNDIFETAFGYGNIPYANDFVYIPLFKKIYKVVTPQPRRGHLAQIGWWEVYLGKFEDDETVGVGEEIMNIYENIPGFDNDEEINVREVLNEFKEIVDNTVIDAQKILDTTNIEKSKVTNNATVLMDSTDFIDLKTTEAYREFISKRLEILSVNPDKNLRPINMYNSSKIDARSLALTYSLRTLTNLKNIKQNFGFTFNYVLLKKYSGEVIDINQNNSTYLTIRNNRNKFELLFHVPNAQPIPITYVFDFSVLYNISVLIDTENVIKIVIQKLDEQEKTIEYQRIFPFNVNLNVLSSVFDQIKFYGGDSFFGDFTYIVDDEIIFNDKCKPILLMNKYPTFQQ